MQKLYCYVDESGQDTGGKYFLVVVVLKEAQELLLLEKILLKIEIDTNKRKLKWKKTPHAIKNIYLNKLYAVSRLGKSLFYAQYLMTKKYSQLTSLTIAKAIFTKGRKNYISTITIDGLNEKEKEIVRQELKRLKIRYQKIRGMKDEQSVFLRLADSIAGFLRDSHEGKAYTKLHKKLLLRIEALNKP